MSVAEGVEGGGVEPVRHAGPNPVGADDVARADLSGLSRDDVRDPAGRVPTHTRRRNPRRHAGARVDGGVEEDRVQGVPPRRKEQVDAIAVLDRASHGHVARPERHPRGPRAPRWRGPRRAAPTGPAAPRRRGRWSAWRPQRQATRTGRRRRRRTRRAPAASRWRRRRSGPRRPPRRDPAATSSWRRGCPCGHPQPWRRHGDPVEVVTVDRSGVGGCVIDSDLRRARATTLLWLVRVSEREVNPHAADLQLCVQTGERGSKSAGWGLVDVSEGGLEPPRPLKGTSTSS